MTNSSFKKHYRQRCEYDNMLKRKAHYERTLASRQMMAANRYSEQKQLGKSKDELSELLKAKNKETGFMLYLQRMINRNDPDKRARRVGQS